MLILLIRYKLCAVRIRHIISTSEGVSYKQVNHQVLVQRCTIQKYIPVDESLILLIYQIKITSGLWHASRNQLKMRYHSKLLVSDIPHIEMILCTRNILGGIPYQEI